MWSKNLITTFVASYSLFSRIDFKDKDETSLKGPSTKQLLLNFIGGWQTNLKVHLPPPTGLEYGQWLDRKKERKEGNILSIYLY